MDCSWWLQACVLLFSWLQFSSDPVAGCRDLAWINAVIGRIFWDFLQEKYWADQVAHKIQKKLSKIRVRK